MASPSPAQEGHRQARSIASTQSVARCASRRILRHRGAGLGATAGQPGTARTAASPSFGPDRCGTQLTASNRPDALIRATAGKAVALGIGLAGQSGRPTYHRLRRCRATAGLP